MKNIYILYIFVCTFAVINQASFWKNTEKVNVVTGLQTENVNREKSNVEQNEKL